ncbi:CoB--CoM heterodisulfide reductase iron-sulfur subunit A family protein [Desulforamulus aquiferis]|uniref:CoB--CoM heterodisulfide reductase iron-sulfur subunit A family protein n=2 Tax=Desulforamulus aquiferis TaxID=1397668 RepID=A0AAW7ZDW5_9FIRM|nr:CoB--CoM heterodisulfide reductase iron-sulfur subunit A family protein [Desulforamulus aquiferis]MDO7787576.1 CoB--CoM heterodisulfide reductase iron-sulfur subunit A family protein [Desulforamulus aquiferis]
MSAKSIGAVLVVGSGIAGIQASLDLAESGYYVYMVEKEPAIGGTMPMLDKTFPTNDCSMCILSPKLVDCGRHLNVKTMTNSEVISLEGEPGNFKVTIRSKARFVDPDKCTGCGSCAEACPVKVDDEFNQGLGKRRAIYKLYAQAFPNAYAIDNNKCLKFKNLANEKLCGKCLKACQAGAINHHMQDEEIEIEVGSVLLVPGFEIFDPAQLELYKYGQLKNVVTSLEFERILSASGPFGGHLIRPSDHEEPKKIAWIQCVGSRNCRINHGYCSSVCCMYAIKQSVIAKEHAPYDLNASIFYMDMRTYGKDFEKYYERSKAQYGVNFVRSRVYGLDPGENDNVSIRYALEDGSIITEEYDMVVLSVGLEPNKAAVELAKGLGVELNQYNFADVQKLTGVATNKEGIYVAGAFSGPRDIPETVMQASAAAGEVQKQLAEAKGTLTLTKEYPAEKDLAGEIVRTGVFVCHCGINIGSVVDVPGVAEYAKTLPGVVYATDKLYACSQDASAQIKEAIEENNLNRIIVASCSPRTHEPMFQETLKEAGLNPHLFEMANIRDHCSWVHQNEPAAATEKAKDLVKMAVKKAALLEPVQPVTLPMNHDALVIGGGVAGMNAALNLADQGYQVYLVEKAAELGGIAKRIHHGMGGEDIQAYLGELINQITTHDKIKVYTGVEIADVHGFMGNYETKLSNGEELKHGVAIIATGAAEYKPEEYLYGHNTRVRSLLEIEGMLAEGQLKNSNNYVFIQCVGSRDNERPYCSRICCTKAVKLALKIKEAKPSANIFILYRDIRTYGYFEDLYTEARRKGIIFVRYSTDQKPVVEETAYGTKVTFSDHVLNRPVEIFADVIGLATAIVPNDNTGLSKLFKVPVNAEGFFLEAHLKLRPVDFGTDGVFMCGLAHGPKNLEENIAQGKAAAGRVATALAKANIQTDGKAAYVIQRKCAACGVCVEVCPSKAATLVTDQRGNTAAEINPALCKGCGACASSCRCGAINVKGCSNEQIMSMVQALA